MEIITASRRMHELACPPGKTNERRTNSRLTPLAGPRKTHLKREPPELGRRRIRINDVVTCLMSRDPILLQKTLLGVGRRV